MKTAIRPAPRASIAVAALATIFLGASYLYIPVPAGTPLDAHLSGSLSSSTASPGQTFGIVAARPLVVQGNVVVTQGAIGQGHVVSVRPMGKKPAMIAVQFDWILSVDGRRISLAASKPASAASNSSNTATPTPVASGSYAGVYGGSSATSGGAYGSASGTTGNASGTSKPLTFGPGGPFAKHFPKGKNVEVGSDLVFPAYVGEYTTVAVN